MRPWTADQQELLMLVRGAIGIAIEVAVGRAAEVRLLAETRRQARELKAAQATLEQKADELTRASAYKSQFLASMSHELRTPLNAIIGFSELMHDGAVPPDSPMMKEFLGDILSSGRHLLQLINDVLDLSKVEAGKLELLPEPIRVSSVVAEVLSILKAVAAKRRIQIDTELDPTVDEVVLDPARHKQVLYNYLSNAPKFSAEGSRVTVRTLPLDGARVRLEVHDAGPGITPGDVDRLFADYQQTDHGVRHGGGTGLGLSLTKRLVEAQGGSVGVTSVVGRGSVFHAVLPRIWPPPGAEPPPSPAPLPAVVRAGAPKVLVVEDDGGDRDLLVAALGQAGYAVESVGTGREAIARCEAERFDAITLDLILPDMSGLEILERIRAGRCVETPVVVVTMIAERGVVAGFDVHDLLAKPLDDGVLIASLERAGVHVVPKDHILVELESLVPVVNRAGPPPMS